MSEKNLVLQDAELCEAAFVRHRDPEDMKALVIRLNKIEGTVRGIRRMVERDDYCMDILVQVAAVNSALNGFSKQLLKEHLKTVVREDMENGHEEKLDEFIESLQRFLK